MEFIDDYRSKKKLAERLRKRADAMSKVPAFNPIVTTQGNENFPGMQQANIAAPIAQIGSAIFGNMAENRAQEAEDERVEARRAALRGLLGGGAAAPAQGNAPPQFGALGAVGGQMTPEQQAASGLPSPDGMQTLPGQLPPGTPPLQVPEQGGIQNGKPTLEQLDALVELGVDPSIIKMYMADDDKLGAEAQAALTRQGRAILVLRGKMSQETKDKMDAEEDAIAERKRTDELTMAEKKAEIEARFRKDPQGRAPNMIDLWLTNPEKAKELLRAQAEAKGTGASGRGKGANPDEIYATMDELEKNIKGNPQIFDWTEQARSAAINASNERGGFTGNLGAAALSRGIDPAVTTFNTLASKLKFEHAKDLFPVSNVDLKALEASIPSQFTNQDAALAAIAAKRSVIDKIRSGEIKPKPGKEAEAAAWMQSMGLGGGVQAPAKDQLDLEMEGLYGGGQ